MKINLNNKNLYVLGDTHTLNFTYYLKKAALENFVLIGLGDHGEGFFSPGVDKKSIEKLQEYCESNNGQIFIIRGNHSNPSWFVENSEFNTELVKFLPDYTILEVEQNENIKKILCVGGAISIDRTLRTEGKDFWSGEGFQLKEDFENLPQCDIMLCHSAPQEAFLDNFHSIKKYFEEDYVLKDELIQERNNISALFNHIKPLCLFHGHFHMHYVNFWKGENFNCAFKGLMINEIVKVL